MTDRPTDKAKDHFAYASQRAYEANSRVVRAADEMYQKVNTMT